MMQGCAARQTLESPALETRLEPIAARLIAPLRMEKVISIQIFSSGELAAYSRSDGHILISSTLVQKLTNEELTAVIAHELGHLINNGNVHFVAALAGSCASDDEESAADQTALQILRATQQRPTALITMLGKIADDSALSPQTRQRIAQRITRLKSIPDAN